MQSALFIFLLLSACAGREVAAAQRDYEFQGRVLTSEGRPFRTVQPAILFYSHERPYRVETQVDLAGGFKLKNLEAGLYTLVIAVPRRGEMQQTISIRSSEADNRGRIKSTFYFAQNFSSEQHMVAASQLAIPADAKQKYAKALECLARSDTARAQQFLKEALERAPDYAAALNHTGTMAFQSGDYPKAEGYFRRAIENDPLFFSPLVNLGGTLLAEGKFEEALAFNLRAVDLRMQDALAHSQLGQNYFRLGQHVLAEVHLKRAKEIDPLHFSFPGLMLAEIYRQRGDHAGVIAQLSEFLRSHPDAKPAAQIRQELAKEQESGESQP